MLGPRIALLSIVVIVIGIVVSAFVFAPSLFGLTTSTTTTASQSQTGTLAVLLTDPPTLPSGATALYINYDKVQVHSTSNATGISSSSAWIDLSASGALDLTGLVNVTQTIASANVPVGSFDSVRFNIVSTVVTFHGSNYTAPFVSGGGSGTLDVSLGFAVSVTGGQSSAMLVNLAPSVLSSGNLSTPEFEVSASAHVYSVPGQGLPPSSFQVGNRINVSSSSWWTGVQNGFRVELQSVRLTSNSLSISVKNTGTNAVTFRGAEVTSFSASSSVSQNSSLGGAVEMFPSLAVSEFFTINPDASFSPLPVASQVQTALATTSLSGGYVLQPGAVVTFTYSGSLTLQRSDIGRAPQNVTAGNSYLVSLWGTGIFEQVSVTAS